LTPIDYYSTYDFNGFKKADYTINAFEVICEWNKLHSFQMS